jgi:photosystem II stability/assembly factor-like uncharacterized protein
MREVSVSPDGTFFVVGVTIDNNYDVLKSTNHGLSWVVTGRLPLDYSTSQPEMVQSLYALSDNNLYAGATYGILMHSTDGGTTWDRSSIGNTGMNRFSTGTEIFFFPPATIIYIRSSSVDVSSDGGQSWDSRGTPNNRSLRLTQFVTPEIGYALLPGELAKTTDGGQNWNISTGFNASMLHFFDALHGVVMWSNSAEDDKGYLMRTYDGGDTWEQFSANERVSWNSWFWLSPQTGWAFGYGGLIRRTDNGGVASVPVQTATPSTLDLHAGYPNPFSASMHVDFMIPFSLEHRASVQFTLFDMLGREVTNIHRGETSAGTHAFTLPRSLLLGLPPGIYLYRLQAAEEIRIGKLTLR